MKNYFVLVFVGICFFACTDQTSKEKNSTLFSEYFYPNNQKAPKIYVYQDSVNGLNEKFFRVYKTKGKDQDFLNVDRFTDDLRITEAYQYSLSDSLRVNDHMVVDAYGEKRKAKVRANYLLPKTLGDESFFSSNFPSALDSLIMIYEVKSAVINQNHTVKFNGEFKDAIIVRDSIKYQVYNPLSEKSKSTVVAQNSIYAKGLGLVSFGSVKNTVLFKLQKILTEEEWQLIKP